MPDPAQRRLLLELYTVAITAVAGRPAVRAWLAAHHTHWPRLGVIAIGKAAESMARGALDLLGERVVSGLIVTKHGHRLEPGWEARAIEVHEAGHPLPDRASLAAGDALLRYLDATPGLPLLVLISGGASALIEVPVAGVDLGFLKRTNHFLQGAGWAIGPMNRVRQALSRIKGGGLLAHLDGRDALGLLISDVPGDRRDLIGSGLLSPVPGLAAELAGLELPVWLRERVDAGLEARGTASVRPVPLEVIATLERALDAAAHAAKARGIEIHRHAEFLDGPAAEVGVRVGRFLCSAPPGLHLWGGETTVELPSSPGRGGRNQHLALAAAGAIEGRDDLWLLAAGTDGSDGPTDDAGALVDGGTVARGRVEGLEVAAALRAADSGRFLEASGDLLQTGPTGTNVMDLLLGLRR